MFEVSVEITFSAAHALTVRGVREPVHGHDWRVTATLAGASLDDDGLLADFALLQRALRDVIEPMRTADLDALPAFAGRNASAEMVARHVAARLQDALAGALPPGVRLASVRVTEAPGCSATWFAEGRP